MSLIEEASGAADTVGLGRLADARVTLIETHIDDESKAAGQVLAEIDLPAATVVAAVVHDGQPVAPTGDYRFHTGDTVLVVTTTATEQNIHDAFQ